MGIIIRNGKQYGFSGKVGTASSVLYDNTNSQIEVATVQEAIDYILENGVSGGGLLEVDLTKVEYDEMVAQDVIVDNVTYYITDDDDEYNASTIVYDNTDTGLEAGNVQGAITEINAKVNEQNKNLGGLRFGVDGDGNYGYYGADDSLIPFKQREDIFWCACGSKNAASTDSVTINTTKYTEMRIIAIKFNVPAGNSGTYYKITADGKEIRNVTSTNAAINVKDEVIDVSGYNSIVITVRGNYTGAYYGVAIVAMS